MIGVPIFVRSYIYGYKFLVIHNTQRPESTYKNNSNSICNQAVCESDAMGEYLNGHFGTNKNISDLATKVLYGVKRRFHVSILLYNIYDDL